MKKARIELIINPVSGKPEPILFYVNKALNRSGIDWDIHITKKGGDIERFIDQIIPHKPDVIAVYGGDGTVMSAAQCLLKKDIPLAIIPGGSANLLSKELQIPQNSQEALEILSKPISKWKYKKVDMGKLNNGDNFILRLGLGFAADKVKMASRSMKEKYGMFAYSIAGVQAFKAGKEVRYTFIVDGNQHEETGYSCSIFNASHFGVGNLSLSELIDPSDGYLDLVLFKTRNFAKMMNEKYLKMMDLDQTKETILHWRGKEIEIKVDQESDIQIDGELTTGKDIKASVLPAAVRIVVP